ncbi:MAG: carboxypeptidase regulatory-like domain-containing protein, partial [Sandaracinaceae bacterium]|nr:carboxypeptidase regulatory-like domain-containing protein [Sandaracinaceae bacterium]
MKRRRWLGALGALALGVVLLLLLWRHDHAEHQERGPTPGAPSRAEGSGEAGPQRERASGWDAGAATAARRPTAPIRLSSARAAPAATSSGVLEGRVVGWASARPIAGAELTFASDRGATSVAASVRSDSQGNFRFEPASPGAYHLALAVAEGFLPFAPDLGASPIHFEARPGARVEGAQVFLVDAVRYEGRVVDASERPVASCPVRLLGGPRIEQSLLPLPDRYVTDDQGRFDFVAPDESVFEAVHPSLGRGRASVDSAVQVSHRLTIRLGGGEGLDGSQSIAGLVVDEQGRPIEDARVRASFLATAGASDHELHPLLEARSDASGRFTIAGADRGDYRVGASAGGYASAVIAHVSAGARDLRLVLGSQSILRARGTDSTGAPIAAPSVIVERALGPLAREAVDVVSGYDAEGWVEVHGLAAGSYEVTLAAAGFAPAS